MKVATKKIFMSSLGCSKNLVDAEVMLGMLQKESAQIVDDPAIADIIIVNTCSFVEDAKEESVETILEMIDYKKDKCQLLIVSGCMSQRYPRELADELPEVDLFVGTGEYQKIISLIEDLGDQKIFVNEPVYIHSDDDPRINSEASYMAWLKVAEGCDRRCSFCIIPKLRGGHRRREVDSLVTEAKRLVESGVKELNLISQDLSQYGPELVILLQKLEELEGLEWIRLLYFYPDDLNDDLIDYMAGSKKLCRYLDMPIQHFSDAMLKRMNRKITGQEILNKIAKLRQRVPGIVLRTSIIVGFPGESEEDFEILLDGIEKASFDHLGVFGYSDEEDTASYKMSGKLDSHIIEERKAQVYQLQEEISADGNQKYLGKKMTVLVEGLHPDTELLISARHGGQAPEVDGRVIINDIQDRQIAQGDLVEVEVTEVAGLDLVAQLS